MKKIAFSDKYGLTQAVVDLIKTNTRRAEKSFDVLPLEYNPFLTEFQFEYKDGIIIGRRLFKGSHVETYHLKPLYKIGEEVAVAQAYKDIYPNADFEMAGKQFITESAGWNNKMFVLADLMPHRIRITNIKLERLQDISEANIFNEGIRMRFAEGQTKSYFTFPTYDKNNPRDIFLSPREAFAALIDRISGKGTWERNPWVFAYEFELVK
mgnify:CR=1 FL=1